MLKRVLILGRRDERVEYDTPQSFGSRLNSASKELEYDFCNLEDLIFVFDGDKLQVTTAVGRDISEYAGLFLIGWFKTKILEDLALSTATYAKYHGIPVWNSEAVMTRSRSKLSQYVLAATRRVSITPFVVSVDSSKVLESLTRAGIRFPCIAKSVSASRGADNYLVKSNQDLKQILESSDKLFVIQTFVPNDGDYRLIVMEDSVTMAIHRMGDDTTHLNNTSKGGSATLVDVDVLNQTMLKDAVTISQAINREITGVDMIIHKETGQHYMLEINNMPQLSTGSFVDEKSKMLNDFFEQKLLS